MEKEKYIGECKCPKCGKKDCVEVELGHMEIDEVGIKYRAECKRCEEIFYPYSWQVMYRIREEEI